MPRYWYRICPVCEEGRLFFQRRSQDGRLSLLCEECFSEFNTPEESNSGANALEGIDFNGTYASSQDIAALGWFKYPLHQVD